MNSKQKLMSYIVVIAVSALLAVTAVTASAWRPSHTPLYTMRMEQASSEMNFLSTARNSFAYTTGRGYELNCNVAGYCGAGPAGEVSVSGPCIQTECYTCWPTCVSTCSTCVSTCPSTCSSTCGNTCGNTCDDSTCGNTCPNTCGSTCGNTCPSTCVSTCVTCVYTCWGTCAATC